MFILHGPTYRYQGEQLAHPEIIYIQDHHYDPEHGYALRSLLGHSLIPSDQHLLVFDHVNLQQEFDQYPHVCLPLLLAAETQEFNAQGIDPAWSMRTHAFNFIINKPRRNRWILLEMISDLGLTNCCYSLCWSQGFRNIHPTDFRLGTEIQLERGFLTGSYRNAETYATLLKTRVFEPTAVSLITEPAFYERETIVTEKTLMAIWAGTLPIWIGGWRCADFMRNLGFDVFDDIIDHGYQTFAEPEDRCRHAVRSNQNLLRSPLDLQSLRPRLEHNLSLLRSNIFMHLIRHTLNEHPYLKDIVRSFRGGCLSSLHAV